MQKKLIILVILVAVVVGAYFVFGGSKEVKNEELGNTNDEQPSGKKMAFSQFLKQGGAYKCEVKQYMSDFENSGTMYISGKNMRGEFSTVAEGRTMNSSFISRDGYSYTWSSVTPGMGFKIKAEAETSNESAGVNGTYAWSADQIGDYNCESWVVDTTKFELPKDVTFQEIKSN
jgi:hypothetical protein